MAKKRYYNESEDKWYTEGQSMTRRIEKSTIWSGVPTLEQLTEWGYVEYIEPTPPTPEPVPIERQYKELVAQKVHARYSYDDEIAILRQKDAKPQDYKTYYDFVEACKEEAREELHINE